VAGSAPGHHARLEILRHGCLSDRDDPIEEHWYAAACCGTEEADAGSDVGRSQRGKPIEGIFGTLTDPSQGSANHLSLVSELIVIHTSATSGHSLGRNS
jgi:hypothetical protein